MRGIDIRDHGGTFGGGNKEGLIKIHTGLTPPASPRQYDLWVREDFTPSRILFQPTLPTAPEENTLVILTTFDPTNSGARYVINMARDSKITALQQIVQARLYRNGQWEYPKVQVYIDGQWAYLSGLSKDDLHQFIYFLKISSNALNLFKIRIGDEAPIQVSNNTDANIKAPYYAQALNHPNGRYYGNFGIGYYHLGCIDRVTGAILWQMNVATGASGALTSIALDRYGGILYAMNYTDVTGRTTGYIDENGIKKALSINHFDQVDFYKDEKVVAVTKGGSVSVYSVSRDANNNPTFTLLATAGTISFEGSARYPDRARFDKNGNLFVTYGGGAYIAKYDEATNTFVPYKSTRLDAYVTGATDFFIDYNGDFYVTQAAEGKIRKYKGTDCSLIYQINNANYVHYRAPVSSYMTDSSKSTFLIDKNNNVLISKTSGPLGVNLLDANGNLIQTYLFPGDGQSPVLALEFSLMTVFPELAN